MNDLLRHRAILLEEYQAEKEEYFLRTSKLTLRQRLSRGLCLYPLHPGRNYYNSLNQLVVELHWQVEEDDDTLPKLFEYGKPVDFFTVEHEGTHEERVSALTSQHGSVSYAQAGTMAVVIPDSSTLIHLQNAQRIGLQLHFDETSYQAMLHAIDDAIKAKKGRLAELRDIFSGRQKAAVFSFNPLRFPWLNASQEKAVNEVLWAKDVAVVHGPPGTGKTTTLVEAIYETLRRETQVLVCAQSNMAVDWISEKLVDHGVNVLRLGNPTRVNDKMLSFTYERRFSAHPDYSDLWSLRQAIRQIHTSKKHGESVHDKLSRLKDRADELEMRIRESLFNEARVVACTLVGAANRLLVGKRFSTVFIDEAAQALEAACWIPLRRCGRLVLAGDHQQLPPTMKTHHPFHQPLTLMERIVANQPGCVTLLTVQYRMNDAIMHFSSEWFYGGKVSSSPTVMNRSILDLDTPMEWIDTSRMEDKPSGMTLEAEAQEPPATFAEQLHGESRVNPDEARLTISVLEGYVEKISATRFRDERIDVGVISPYKAQTHELRRLLKTSAVLKPIRKQVTIDTVDGFQGQERDIIVISLVRNNDDGNIGFLNDLRRMNVAITRARMKLFIIGATATLCHHPFYRRLHEYVAKLDGPSAEVNIPEAL